MSRYVKAAIAVVTIGGFPSRFRWRGVWHDVAVVKDFWREVGAWWAGELEKDVFMLVDTDRGLYEIMHERATGGWLLNRVME